MAVNPASEHYGLNMDNGSDELSEQWAAIIRDMIRHEDALTNHRMTWFLSVQGLLFAALAFAWNTGPELVVVVLSPLGILLCIAFRSILVIGPATVSRLAQWWEVNKPALYGGPDVIGAQCADLSKWLGRTRVGQVLWPWNNVPVILTVAWVAAAGIRIFYWLSH